MVERLSPPQHEALRGIVLGSLRTSRRYGVPLPGVLLVATVSADAESDLNPNAVGDDGTSVGLYQFHFAPDGRALGDVLVKAGHTLAELRNPVTSTELIMSYAARWEAFRDNAQLGSVAGLLAWFTRTIERPRNPDQAVAARVELARSWLADPAWAYLPMPELRRVSGVTA